LKKPLAQAAFLLTQVKHFPRAVKLPDVWWKLSPHAGNVSTPAVNVCTHAAKHSPHAVKASDVAVEVSLHAVKPSPRAIKVSNAAVTL
jgi:hypothetical protein